MLIRVFFLIMQTELPAHRTKRVKRYRMEYVSLQIPFPKWISADLRERSLSPVRRNQLNTTVLFL